MTTAMTTATTSAPKTMRFVDFSLPGGPEYLKISEMPVPEPREREVLIRVAAAGVNRPDIAQRQGKYPPPPDASPVLGLEVSGTIVAVGKNSRWRVGQEVCALVPGGGYAEFCLSPDVQCLELPRGLTMIEAAGIPENFFTVWANVFQIGQLARGDRFLVHGGSSGIGVTAIQLARVFGAEVFTTAGSPEKCAACESLGASVAINYKTQDFVEEIKKRTEGRGVTLVLDMVGGSYTARNIEVLAVSGRLVQIAVQQGAEVSLPLAKLMMKRIHLTGSTLRPRSIEDKGLIATELREKVWPLLEAKKVQIVVDRVFPFEDVIKAHQRMESSEHIGKIILSF